MAITPQTNIKAVITAEDKASAVIKGFGDNVDKQSQSVSNGLNASALAVTAATAGIVAFGKKAFDAFSDQDLAVTRLRTGINNVKSATDKNIDSLLQEAAALQKVTRFSDEQYISAQGILSTFQLNQRAIEKLTPRLADMSEGLARVNGGLPDLEGNAILVAKAIGGEDVAGLTGALRKAGVTMTKTQTELLQTGTVEQRVALITQVLDQNFRGMATAAGDTAAGKVAILKNQFNDLEERVGSVIATALIPFLNVMNQHPVILEIATGALGALAFAFIAVKVAAAIGTVIQGVTVALGAMTAAASGATIALSTLSAVSIGGWAALVVADLYLVRNAANSVKGAFDAVYDSANAAANLAPEAEMRSLQKQAAAARAMGDTAKVNSLANAIAALGGGRAKGGHISAGVPYLVGEEGAEIVVPQSSGTVIPNNKLSDLGGSGTVNIVVNVGLYAGSEQEKRKVALELLKSLKDVASAKSTSVGQMLGA